MFWLLFMFSVIGMSQTPPPPTILTEAILDSRLGKEWQGILFACDPYCRFISIRQKTKWNPPISQLEVNLEKLEVVAKDDPLYPLLVTQNPILPYVESEPTDVDIDPATGQARLKEVPPKFAQTTYGMAWSLALGENFGQEKRTSNTEIQAQLKPKGFILGQAASAQLWFRPTSLFKSWYQVALSANLLTGKYVTPDTKNVATSEQTFAFRVLHLGPYFKFGPRFAKVSRSAQVSVDNLTHFSNSWNGYLLGGDVIWQRWTFSIDTLLQSSLTETQSFRSNPIKQDLLKLGLAYCSRNLSLFDISFGLCSGLAQTTNKEKAALSPGLASEASSSITASRLDYWLAIRIGEDLFK